MTEAELRDAAGATAESFEHSVKALFNSGVHRVYVRTALTDGHTQRVAAERGFTREGIARGAATGPDGTPQDLVVWARLADDPDGPSPRALPDLPDGGLTDGVVTLRPLAAGDAPDTYRLRALPEVRGRSLVSTRDEPDAVARQCAQAVSDWLAGRRAAMTVRLAADDTYLGEIALFYAEPVLREAMIGYSLAPEARGQGHAARAARLVTDWGFEIGMARMVAGTAPDNVASQRVLEAAGYYRECLQLSRLPGPDGGRIDNIQFVKLRPAVTL